VECLSSEVTHILHGYKTYENSTTKRRGRRSQLETLRKALVDWFSTEQHYTARVPTAITPRTENTPPRRRFHHQPDCHQPVVPLSAVSSCPTRFIKSPAHSPSHVQTTRLLPLHKNQLTMLKRDLSPSYLPTNSPTVHRHFILSITARKKRTFRRHLPASGWRENREDHNQLHKTGFIDTGCASEGTDYNMCQSHK